jgi:predicted alpha/beta superfamily hydrolase
LKGNVIEEVFCSRKLTIYLPPSYSKSKVAFPVIYVQDGKSLLCEEEYYTLKKLESFFNDKKLREVIIVGIDSDNRIDDYTPWPAKALSDKFKDFGGKGKEYLEFIVNSLKPYIASEYNGDINYNNNCIAGSSLGGLISLYASFLYPKEFGKICAISPSLWYEKFIEYIRCEALIEADRKIYLDVGSKEGNNKTTSQKYMVENVEEAYKIFMSKGFNEKNLKLFIEKDAVHGEKAFRKRLPNAVTWLFQK